MRKLLAVGTMAAALGCAGAAYAQGSVEAGGQKSAVCAACHGPDGNSPNPEWPSLAGQHQNYIVAQLRAFQEGSRQDPLMTPMALGLSEQDMLDLAAFYHAQAPVGKEAEPDLVEHGRQIYLGGDLERGIAACVACHGPTGRGNPLAGYPIVAGQHASYATATLNNYASGERPNPIMQEIAVRMSDEDIRAVSAYLQGLR